MLTMGVALTLFRESKTKTMPLPSYNQQVSDHMSQQFLFDQGSGTLGARDFSCVVSGFGQVLKSDPRDNLFLAASPLVSSAEGRRRVGLQPTKLLVTREKKSLVHRVRFRYCRHILSRMEPF